MTKSTAIFLGGLGLLGSISASAPWPTALVGLSWCYLAWARGVSMRAVVVGALLFITAGVRAKGALDAFVEARDAIEPRVRGSVRCDGQVQVESSPTLAATESGLEAPPLSSPRSLWVGSATGLECEGGSIAGPVKLRLSSEDIDLGRGDELRVLVQVGPTQYFQNEGGLDPRLGAARRGTTASGTVVAVIEHKRAFSLPSAIDRVRAHVRRRIFATFRREVVPLARALVLGENDLSDEETIAFSKSGLMHILAVSGTHLVLAVVSLERALFAILVRISGLAARFDVARASGAIGTLLAFLYADFAGGSGSARRAAYMLAIVLGGRALGFRAGGPLALGASLGVGLAVDPLIGFDISFLLSALATLGLLYLAPLFTRPVEEWTVHRPWVRAGLVAMATTLSSSLACAPLLAFLGGQMTGAALVANVIAGPLGELLALPACLIHTLTSAWPALERGLAAIGGGALYLVRASALTSASIEALAFRLPAPDAWGTAALSAFVLHFDAAVGMSRFRRMAALGFGLLLTLGCFSQRRARPPFRGSALSITALDVGQGDSLYLEFPNGEVGLLDGGGYPQNQPDIGRRVILPFLRAKGRTHLDLLILSHADRDHLLGLLAIASELRVQEFWYPGIVDPSPDLQRLLTLLREKGTRIQTAAELCDVEQVRGAALLVLAPCGEATELGRNDASLVLQLRLGRHIALLTGDIELAGEQALLERGRDLRADFMKVAHHGSITSSSEEWVQAVRPRVAFFSLGVRNTFGHPSPLVLSRLEANGAETFRTDRLGALTWTTNGTSAYVSSYRAPTWREVSP